MAHERILIVEDEVEVGRVIEVSLAQNGYTVVAIAATAEEGLRQAGQLRPDLALLDIHLGDGLDGVSVAERLRLDFNIPVIFLTGLPDETTLQRSREAQAFGYLLKPFRPEELKASIDLALDRHRNAQQLESQREHSEHALRGSEERYRRLFELCPDAVLVQCEGRIELINSAGAKLFGAERPEQIIGRDVMEFVHPDYQQAVWERVTTMHEGGAVTPMEQRIVQLDGTVVDVEVTPGALVFRDRPAVQAILRDIRKRKRLQFQNAQITQLSHRLNSSTTPKQAAQIIVETAECLLGWDACNLSLYLPAEDVTIPLVTMDEIDGRRQHVPVANTTCAPTPRERQVMREGGALILRGTRTQMEPALFRFGDINRPSASLLFAPIRDGSKVIGLVSIQSYKEQAYSPDDLVLLQFLADHCGGALERLRAQEALRQNATQLRSLAAHLQSVREEERIRIAREIHDELGQLLTGFKMDLAWVDKRLAVSPDKAVRARVVEHVRRMSAMVDDMVDSVRRISAELRPGVLDDLGLVAAMEWQMREFQKRFGVQCCLTSQLGAEQPPASLGTALFRIFQETLTNVARHARATRVSVVLEQTTGGLLMKMEDNGRGITEQELADPKSLGLAGMRERATALGGDFQIRPLPGGSGTMVRVSVPLLVA